MLIKKIFLFALLLIFAIQVIAQNDEITAFDNYIKTTNPEWKGFYSYKSTTERAEILQTITTINLSGKGLKVFPVEILECLNLKVLSLGSNPITSIPAEIARLENLQELELGYTEIKNAELFTTFQGFQKDVVYERDYSDIGIFKEKNPNNLTITLTSTLSYDDIQLIFELQNINIDLSGYLSLVAINKDLNLFKKVREQIQKRGNLLIDHELIRDELLLGDIKSATIDIDTIIARKEKDLSPNSLKSVLDLYNKDYEEVNNFKHTESIDSEIIYALYYRMKTELNAISLKSVLDLYNKDYKKVKKLFKNFKHPAPIYINGEPATVDSKSQIREYISWFIEQGVLPKGNPEIEEILDLLGY